MRTDLIIRGAELLEADAKNPEGVSFNLSEYATTSRLQTPLGMHCGTSACAIGLFCLSGAFKEDGLNHNVFEAEEGLWISPNFRMIDSETGGTVVYRGYYAAAKLFDISNETAIRLFSPEYYEEISGAKAELAVAARMRALVMLENEKP